MAVLGYRWGGSCPNDDDDDDDDDEIPPPEGVGRSKPGDGSRDSGHGVAVNRIYRNDCEIRIMDCELRPVRCVQCGGRQPPPVIHPFIGPYGFPNGLPLIKTWEHLCTVLEQLVPQEDARLGAFLPTIAEVLCHVVGAGAPPPPPNLSTFAELQSMVQGFPTTTDYLHISYACRMLYRVEEPIRLYVWLNKCSNVLRDSFLDTMAYGSETIVRSDHLRLFSGRRRIADADVEHLRRSPSGSVFELDSVLSSSYDNNMVGWFMNSREESFLNKAAGVDTPTRVMIHIDIEELLRVQSDDLPSYIIDMSTDKCTYQPEVCVGANKRVEQEVILRPRVQLKLLHVGQKEMEHGSPEILRTHLLFHFKLLATKVSQHPARVHMGSCEWLPS
jgi:hypothetical protein